MIISKDVSDFIYDELIDTVYLIKNEILYNFQITDI